MRCRRCARLRPSVGPAPVLVMKTNINFSRPEQMLDPPALAAMLCISLRHLSDTRRDDPTFPEPRMLGTLPRWSPDAIRAWMWSPASSNEVGDPAPEASASSKRSRKEGRGRVQ